MTRPGIGWLLGRFGSAPLCFRGVEGDRRGSRLCFVGLEFSVRG